jgi:type I restriction enzyme, S subunit
LLVDSLPAHWRIVRLADLGEVNRGRSRHRPRYAEHLYGGPYPFIQTGDIKASGGRITTYKQTYSEAGLAQSRLWPVNTMCITIAANIAETAILTFPACFPDSVVGFVPDDAKCDVRFIEYLFRRLRAGIQFQATGSVQDNINLETLAQLSFPLPPLSDQKRIAEVLASLDDKIELNLRMNETLEAMARTMFRSWFVDFDPNRAKSEGRQPYGMDAESAAFFPGSFENSALGRIPKGWRAGKIADILTLSRETITPEHFPAEAFNHYSIPAFDEGRWPKEELGDQIKSNKLLVAPNTVLLSKLNPRIPRIWLPSFDSARRSIASTEFLVASPKNGFSRTYLFALLNSQPFLDVFTTLVTGTSGSHQRVTPESLLQMDTLIPSHQCVQSFTRVADPLYLRIANNLAESGTLAAVRDTLLPKLISGEISVGNSSHVVEDIA